MDDKSKLIVDEVSAKIKRGELTQLERALFNAWLSHGRLTELEREIIGELERKK